MSRKSLIKNSTLFKRYYQLYFLLLPALVYIIIFHYIPMYGVQIAFKDFSPSRGIWDSRWVGMKNFLKFWRYPMFWDILRNTLTISIYQLAAGFPVPILLAIMINEVQSRAYKKTVQMITYAPHFISMVVLCGMITLFLNKQTGMINNIVAFTGGQRLDYMTSPNWFKTIYVFSGVWQNAGWGTIIYLAALSGVDPELIEAAKIDGASRLQKIWYIDIPAILPVIIILLIMQSGQIMSVGFEKILLLQNPVNMTSSDVIATYVYRNGLLQAQYSFASAIGLFNNIINLILLITVNTITSRLSQMSLW
ncbi:MAG: ABC transporter permease subunit [Treponema sp.]|nr:ABC transporter permease subunit [Treponema sp.]